MAPAEGIRDHLGTFSSFKIIFNVLHCNFKVLSLLVRCADPYSGIRVLKHYFFNWFIER